jgi:beta-lactamase regulating signal transducer with metallopeptidase domain
MAPADFAAPDRAAEFATLLAPVVVKATLVLMLGTVCALGARAASAATRHLIWTLTLAGALVVPIASAVVPAWRVPVAHWAITTLQPRVPADVSPAIAGPTSNIVLARAIPAADAARPRVDGVRRRGAAAPSVATTTATPATAAARSGRPTAVAMSAVVASAAEEAASVMPSAGVSGVSGGTSVATWAIGFWLLGVLAVLTPTLVGMARVAMLRRNARAMRGGRWALLVPSVLRELDIRRRVRFLELDGAVMPMTWGVMRPVVLLPSGDFDSTIEQRLDVLRHELAHVRRHDCLTQLVGQLACAIYWFNPLAWIAVRQLRVEREHACDDEVLRAGSKASAYADYLLRVARTLHMPGVAAFGGLAMARPSQLTGRLLAVLDDARRRGRISTSAAVRGALATIVIVATLGSLSPEPASARAIAAASPTSAVAPVPLATTAAPARLGAAAPTVTAPAIIAVPVVGSPAVTASGGGRVAAASVITGTVAPAVLPNRQQGVAPCDRNARSGKSSHSNWTSSDNGGKRWRVQWSSGDCSYEIEARGEITYNGAVTDIASISTGGSFTLEQHIGDETRRLSVRPGPNGALVRSYTVDGARRDYDAAAQAWFAEALVALDRQTAFAVDQRVPAILERSGVNGVLQEISLLASDYARRRYYTKLLSVRQLERQQVRRIVEQAGTEMSSDYELAELLVALAKLDAFADDSHMAFVSAVKSIDSDYEGRRALNALLRRDQLAPATVESLLDAATSIDSDYELAELLIDVSKRYAIDDRTRPMYIKAVGSIASDYEHRRVLGAIVAGGGLSSSVMRALLEDAARITSDYELAEFLIQIAGKGTLDESTRDAYFAAADQVGSDYEHHRALKPLLKRDLLTKPLARAILMSATKIESDYECASLLIEVANAITIDDDLRPAFERAADTIQGEYEYGRAMSAVRRRITR